MPAHRHHHVARAAWLAVLLALGCRNADKPSTPPPAPAASPPAQTASASVSGERLLSDEELARWVAGGAAEQWFGLYMGETKAGYAVIEHRPSRDGEPGAYVIYLRATIGGDRGELTLEDTSYYDGAPPYPLVEAVTTETTSAGKSTSRFVATQTHIEVVDTVDGKAKPARRLPPTCQTLESELATMVVDPAKVRVGQSATYCAFDAQDERTERETVSVVDVGRRRINGVDTQVAELESVTAGEATTTRITLARGGVTLGASHGNALSLRAQDKEVARRDVAGWTLDASMVPTNERLGDPKSRDELTMIVTVTDGFEIPTGPNQTVTARDDGRYLVRIVRGPGAAVTDEERASSLRASGRFDFDDPSVRARATALTVGIADRRAQIDAMVHWVYRSIEGSLSTNLSTASQVLRVRAGDCTEYAMLFVALARAAGIPARTVSGVTYAGDGLGFAWHEWAEVELDGRWVQVDPSWNESIANATHLRLGAGDHDDAMANLGTLAIEIPNPG